MRSLVMSAGLAACLALGACEREAPPAPPAPKRSMARQDQMYAGETLIQSVTTGSIERGHGAGVLVLKAAGTVPGPGYTRPYFLPRIYPATPPDGIYEVDVVAALPAAPAPPAPPAPTGIKAEGAWSKYADDRVKGVKFMTTTNSLVAMLPPKTP